MVGDLESGSRDRSQPGTPCWLGMPTFCLVLCLPLALGFLWETAVGMNVGYRGAMQLSLWLVFAVLACSGFCGFWMVFRWLRDSTLRVFFGAGLTLALMVIYLALLLFYHYVVNWSEGVG